MKRVLFIVALLVAVLLFLLPALTAAQVPGATNEAGQPVARFLLFYSDTCPHCHEVMENFLPTVYAKYGDQVEYEYININEGTDNYLLMLGLETKLGMSEEEQGYVPALVIGDKILVGGGEIPDQLEGIIDEYLAQGGVDFPATDDLPEVVLPTPEPAVQILVFYDPNDASFEALNALMISMSEKYQSAFQPIPADTSNEQNAQGLADLHEGLGLAPPVPGTPEVLIDRRMLVGIDQIEMELPSLIEQYLAQGGVTIPSWEELTGEPLPATPEPEAKAIHLAYFEQAGCQECARTSYDLEVIQEQYPQVVVESFSMEEADNKALSEWLGAKYGVPEEKRLSTPMIFVGDDVLIGEEAVLDNLLAAVAKYEGTGAPRTWEDFDPAQAEQSLVERFRSFGVLTVLGAGLIDGLNPCAFATLVFFMSYLAFTGRRGRDILFVGISFALGVFLTYLLVGVGLLKVIQSLSFFTALGRWVYLLTALLCVILAIFTFNDFFKARRGQPSEMTLKLPMSLRRRINKVIRENAQTRAFVAMAFVTGFVVSLLELACTGQVYLPTIMFVLSVPDMAAQAFLYLLLYCLMFILPLIVVFVLSYFGTTSEQLGVFVNRHTSTIKVVTGLVFAGLALWMAWTMAPLFGLASPWNWALMAGVLLAIALGVVLLQVRERRAPQKPVTRRRRSQA